MAYYSGVGAQLGFAEETTWSVRVAPARFYEFDQAQVKTEYTQTQGKALRPGQRFARSDRRVVTKKKVTGTVDIPFYNKQMGMLLRHALGVSPVVTTPMGGTNSRLHTYNAPGDPTGFGLSTQLGAPDSSGTTHAIDWTGGKITDVEFDLGLDQLLMFKPTFVWYDEAAVDANAVAAASYTASMGVYSSLAASATVGGTAVQLEKFNFKYSPGLAADRYFLRTDTRIKEPVPAAVVTCEGTLDLEFNSIAQYNNFIGTVGATPAQSNLTLIITLDTQVVIEGSINYKTVITFNAVRFNAADVPVTGPGIIKQSIPFIVLDDGSGANPIVLTYQTTDTVY